MKERNSSLIGGLILIGLGAFFLLMQAFPELGSWLDWDQQWPLVVGAVGIFLLLGAVLGTPPLAVPGSIVTGIGGILYYQNATGNWASWAYIWALIPGFVGVGIILMHLLQRELRTGLREGGRLIGISVVMFVVFAAFFNGLGGIGRFWPVLLIVAGGWILWQNYRSGWRW